MGVDMMHYNLHKTFSRPHGGGGPGAGPIAVRDDRRALPAGRRWSRATATATGSTTTGPSRSAGCAGSAGRSACSSAPTRSSACGGRGCATCPRRRSLNANYLLARLRDAYDVPYDRLHARVRALGARPEARARRHGAGHRKRLIDYDFHPPTVYFPLVVPEALMIEPTETETRETLDAVLRGDDLDRRRGSDGSVRS